jgi:hypothetical protein
MPLRRFNGDAYGKKKYQQRILRGWVQDFLKKSYRKIFRGCLPTEGLLHGNFCTS